VHKAGRRTSASDVRSGQSLGRRTSASDVGSPQNVAALIDEVAASFIDSRDIVDPSREANDLLAALLDVPRHWPLLHENDVVDESMRQRACAAAAKRARGAPLAYAVGQANFRKLALAVDERVLIPRPETELLVDLVLARCEPGGLAMDVGTGSGAIAIALAMEGQFERVIATDISLDAIEVARLNASRSGARNIGFVACDLLPTSDVGRRTSVIVSNPPYVSFDEVRDLPPSVRDWEPMVALLSSRDGLATSARLVRQAGERLDPGGLLALEVDARRASLVAEFVSTDARFTDVSVHLDLTGRERFVLATRREGEGKRA
jgi:release factor glutamine methyltransferase